MDINVLEVIGRQQVDIYALQATNEALRAQVAALREQLAEGGQQAAADDQ